MGVAKPAPVDYLQPDEEPLVETGRHGLSVLDELLGALILAALPITGVLVLTIGFYPQWFAPVAVPTISVVAVLFIGFLIARYWRVATSIYIVTDERVYKSYGRIRFFGSQTTYDKLTDMHVKQSLFGRIWGFGTVRLETAGTGIQLEGVRDPFGFKQQVEGARSAFIRTLVGEGRAAEKTVEVAPDETPARVLWDGRISFVSLLGNLVSVGIALLVGLVTFAGAAAQPRLLLVGIVVVTVAFLMAASVLIRYRFTRYHVGSRGVVVTSGWLTRRRVETTYEKVTDVTVYQGILARLLDFGTITINTAGSNAAAVVFMGVHAPETVKEIIDDARRVAERR